MNVDDQPRLVLDNFARVGPVEETRTTWISGAHRVISRGTASPVLVTDDRWRIVTLNPEAERLLGRSSREANGVACHAVLYGRAPSGNQLPQEQCDVGSMVRRGEPVHPFELDVVNASGERIRTACSVIVLHDGPAFRIVHILTPIPPAPEGTSASPGVAGRDGRTPSNGTSVAKRYALTPRENEVLRLLAQGNDCHQIAEKLFISLPTVRNHVHNFFRKMGVHSQVEAVALAYREGLI